MTENASRLRVLIVEDEALVAMLLEDILLDLGHEAQVFSRLDQACDAAKAGDFDMAILDVNIAGESSTPVARILTERRIPFAFATGYAQGPGGDFANAPILAKPYLTDDVARVIMAIISPSSGHSLDRTLRPDA